MVGRSLGHAETIDPYAGSVKPVLEGILMCLLWSTEHNAIDPEDENQFHLRGHIYGFAETHAG